MDDATGFPPNAWVVELRRPWVRRPVRYSAVSYGQARYRALTALAEDDTFHVARIWTPGPFRKERATIKVRDRGATR